jgi:hypothetical protein
LAEPFPASEDTREPAPADQPQRKDASQWLDEIRQADKDSQRWRNRAKKIVKLYSEDRTDQQRVDKQYAMLWANTEVLKPAVYAREPKPVVSRRFTDQDPLGRNVSEVLQRALTSIFDRSDVDGCLRSVTADLVLVAQGTAWVRYEPSFIEIPADEENQIEAYEQLQDETLRYDFVPWQDFIRPKAKSWDQMPWIARRVYMDKKALEARVGPDLAKEICNSVTEAGTTSDYMQRDKAAARNTYCIYEIWSKRDQSVVWVADGYGYIIDEQPPLYALNGFYPCPKPAFGTLATDSIYPVPDYVYYQDQAEEINELTARIGALTDALKLVGFYPAGAEGEISSAIEKALNPNTENQMIPVPSWAAWTQQGGSKGMIEWLPVDMVANVLRECVANRRQIIEDVYQITGISDILRGSTAASETATAQQIKAQWGGIRIREKQHEIARFSRDICRISAEIIAEKFQPETLWRMTGLKFPTAQEKQELQAQVQARQAAAQQPAAPPPPGHNGGPPMPPEQPSAPPQAPEIPPEVAKVLKLPTQEEIIEVLRNDQVRSYRVDIETDSTIEADENAEKQSRNEFIQNVGGFIAQSVPLAQQAPQLVPVIGEMLLFVARAYRAGRSLEDTIEQAVTNLTEKAEAAEKAPPQPDPQALIEQERLKIENKKVDADAALKQEQLNVDKARLAHERMSAEVGGLTSGLMDPSMLIGAIARITASAEQTSQAVQALVAQQGAPIEMVRDPAGNVVAIRKGGVERAVVRGPDGTVAGLQ